jgi:hypothetical protein
MSDPVISPDGKWMWTGNEWIPAPPGSNNASVSLQDSVVAGDVNITQNSPDDIAEALLSAFSQLNLVVEEKNTTEYKDSSSKLDENKSDDNVEVKSKTIESKPIAHPGVPKQLDPEYQSLRPKISILNPERFRRFLGLNQNSKSKSQLTPLEEIWQNALSDPAQTLLTQFSLSANDLKNHAKKAFEDRNLEKAEKLFNQCLQDARTNGERHLEANLLVDLALIAQKRKDFHEQHRLNTEAVKIWREIGVTVEQWYIDSGY